jgi:acid phosphatase
MKKFIGWLFLSALTWHSASYAASTSFVFVSDSGQGDKNQKRTAQGIEKYCQSGSCQFLASMGDNFDSGVKSVDDVQFKTRFEDVYKNLDFPFYMALGNHDYRGNIQAEIDYTDRSQKWKMPARYYSYSSSDASFFVLDTNNLDDAQLQWLDDGLAAQDKTWKIVYGHHPVYSNGLLHGDTKELINKLLPIMQRHQVNFYLSGHDHDKEVISRSGMMFVVCGTGSQTRFFLRSTRSSLFAKASLGFCAMELSSQQAKLTILDDAAQVEYSTVIKAPAAQ